ncbi:ClpP/crotonase-like domain-containing protein [Phascolomyces articulosus]|uniref:ClpP/crotonase-like domain-containing protein n=1 Tax=Phascolomyces articulosus TaxID=60185 RepID=A0AAD5JNY0_9FUNG|nr:ClpP/crotonase-like domain-containing protein [Phascolomyces articulosus]
MPVPKFDGLEITVFPNGVCEIAFNRPQVLNSFHSEAYENWTKALRWAKAEDSVKVVVFTGRGRYYSSGQDLSHRTKELKKENSSKDIVDELIQFPKLTIAAVNGPAFGVSVSTMAICDIAYCVPHATFTTPFMKLGFAAESCSSYLFPKIMGHSRANEMLLMGRTFSAQEMVEANMIARIYPAEGFREKILDIAGDAAKFSAEAIATTKKLTRDEMRELLLRVNDREMEAVVNRIRSKDSMEAVQRFTREAERKRLEKQKAKQQSKI